MTRFARACLHAAAGDHQTAVADLLAAGDLTGKRGIRNPAMLPWRSAAAVSLVALGDRRTARELAAEEVGLARRWGAGREIGMALRAALRQARHRRPPGASGGAYWFLTTNALFLPHLRAYDRGHGE
jgi:hypothetical protein